MLADVRYALRSLLRAPGFTISAVLALALGIGANTAVFSVVYAVLLAPLPYPDGHRLVRLYETNAANGVGRGEVSAGTFVDWRARSRTLERLAAYSTPLGGETLWTVGERVHVVRISAVSPALFSLLRVQPILGAGLSLDGGRAGGGAAGVVRWGGWGADGVRGVAGDAVRCLS